MIVCNNLNYAYPRSKDGLFNFTFDDSTLPQGICGLFGSNGAGKSTLIKIITGTLLPKSGECLVHKIHTKTRTVNFLKDIANIPEDCNVPHVYPHIYKKHWSQFYPKFDSTLFDTLLSDFDISTDKKLDCMSLGQKKKFLIAFTIATRAQLLLLDEPTNGLDIPSKLLFKQIISKYTFSGQRVIISTHQAKDIEDIIQSLIIVDKGKFLMSASIEQLQQTFTIEKRRTVSSSAKNKDTIFSYPGNDGYTILKKNKDSFLRSKKDNSAIDLELFFTATLQEPAKVIEALTVPEIIIEKPKRRKKNGM